ncbi:lactate dehydrogenase [Burkholderia thailandensis]|uniref:L-lactate dehydrogenase n=1 Tax=Burkholderia thailandensis (strain ATCC 700388 / DSM 13276 / CCUG 48851 / CIP 106301 / E264) TaxID=271848 RepID=Q2T8Q7_BURTA|nr:L-lactate dehydrogenase [Burkholderia thailandensis E264]AOJ47335.1 lactate dehydrogenase [Burkholderia thailandensis]AWY61506.1 lactate dehydrogenase [Burkholderia thailandensis]AWY65584.1 lactate dehydrogenase [Burkholderia thailandensis]KVG10837.1 lactate dehydrogenase [Burkholderia thailandensis]
MKGVTDMSSLDSWTREQFDPTIGWRDVEWVRLRWGGKLIVKGVLDPDDAIRAVDAGADARVVSNHGGRQLDGAMSSVEALPAVVDAAGRRAEVWLDGGVRTGQDVLKAVALGARGTMIGRAFLYGVAARSSASGACATAARRKSSSGRSTRPASGCRCTGTSARIAIPRISGCASVPRPRRDALPVRARRAALVTPAARAALERAHAPAAGYCASCRSAIAAARKRAASPPVTTR